MSLERKAQRMRKRARVKFTLFLVLYSLCLMVVGHLVFSFIPFDEVGHWFGQMYDSVDEELLIFTAAGFIAQMIDGALGMAYGVTATTFLQTFSPLVSPAAVSASVHTSEIFTSGVSGLMHLKFGNVNQKLFKSLLLPGVIGSILGAALVVWLQDYKDYMAYVRPTMAIYCIFLGFIIITKVVWNDRPKKRETKIWSLGAAGGFLDAVGGGGWGPLVSSTLIARGRNPLYTIGSVNLAEFFVSLASSITFIALIGFGYWQVVAGLILGGVIAAPIAAQLSRKLPIKTMMLFVGIAVISVNVRIIYKAIFG
jgi:uncharacterized protein